MIQVDFLFIHLNAHLHCYRFKSVGITLTKILQVMVADNQIYLTVQSV